MGSTLSSGYQTDEDGAPSEGTFNGRLSSTSLLLLQQQQRRGTRKQNFVGLYNLGNTCYCNSVLQALYFCPPFRDRVLAYREICLGRGIRRENLANSLANLYHHIETSERSVAAISPIQFVLKLRQNSDFFGNFRQQDAHELLNFLLNSIAEVPSHDRTTSSTSKANESRQAASAHHPSTSTHDSGQAAMEVDNKPEGATSSLASGVHAAREVEEEKGAVTQDQQNAADEIMSEDGEEEEKIPGGASKAQADEAMREIKKKPHPQDPHKSPADLPEYEPTKLAMLGGEVEAESEGAGEQLSPKADRLPSLTSSTCPPEGDTISCLSETSTLDSREPQSTRNKSKMDSDVHMRDAEEENEEEEKKEERAKLEAEAKARRDRAVPKEVAEFQASLVEVFTGKLLSRVTCQRCGSNSNTEEPFLDLSLSIPTQEQLDEMRAAMLEHLPAFSASTNDEVSSTTGYSSASSLPISTNSNGTVSTGDARVGQMVAPSHLLSAHLQWLLTFAGQMGWMMLRMGWSLIVGMATSVIGDFFMTGHIPLDACLDCHFTSDQLDGDDKYACEKCAEHTSGTKHVQLLKLPDILCIQLKRFRHFGFRQYNAKITTEVRFPLDELDVAPYCSDEVLSEVDSVSESTDSWDGTKYRLVSFIAHFGNSMDYGHYIAYCRSDIDQQWYEYDDERVTQVSETEVASREAYVLFYQRKRTMLKEMRSIEQANAKSQPLATFEEQADEPVSDEDEWASAM